MTGNEEDLKVDISKKETESDSESSSSSNVSVESVPLQETKITKVQRCKSCSLCIVTVLIGFLIYAVIVWLANLLSKEAPISKIVDFSMLSFTKHNPI